jgi:hypothetical protein
VFIYPWTFGKCSHSLPKNDTQHSAAKQLVYSFVILYIHLNKREGARELAAAVKAQGRRSLGLPMASFRKHPDVKSVILQ